MTEMQLTTVLIGVVCFVIVVYVVRSRSAARRVAEEKALRHTVSYDTGRDESQWRRAYSRG